MLSHNTTTSSRMCCLRFLEIFNPPFFYIFRVQSYCTNMKDLKFTTIALCAFALAACMITGFSSWGQRIGVGAKAPKSAEVFFDGSRKMLDEKWTYWKGPRFAGEPPIKWSIVKDPV